MSDSLPFVIVGIEKFKERYPDKTVILGGSGPTGVAREIIRSFPFLDIVAVGEGENTICELMDCLANGGGRDLRFVKGICFRDRGEVFETPPRERISNLDSLPFPLYEKVLMDEYPLVNIVFSRGCPYGCTFCDVAPMWGHRNCRRSVESVIEEMRFLRERYGKTEFEFTDETFVLHQNVIIDFCRQLAARRVDVSWACTGRINLMNEELLSEMSAQGCRGIFYGIESGSDTVLARIKKDFTITQAVEIVRETLKRVHVVTSFVWGFPFETVEDLLKTLLLTVYLSHLGADTRLNRLVPFALTPLFAEYGGRLVWQDIWDSYSIAVPFQTTGYRSEIVDLIREHPSVFPEFYWFPTSNHPEKCGLVERFNEHVHGIEWPVSASAGGTALGSCASCNIDSERL
jgi:anaerobic magnesium-protoporphyrin IX monomethyl ester cyclase